MTMFKSVLLKKWLTTWWRLWIIFFIYTASMAIIVQVILPQVFPEVFMVDGIFVPDTKGFHQIAARKALEIVEKGWGAWELRPDNQYPAGVASIFYCLWKPELYSMIPFNAVVHATSGCLVFFLLTSFMKNRFIAACGAILFIINPASLEWTAQIHRDGTYILGNLLMLTAWFFLIKGVMQKKWQKFSYAFFLTLCGSLLIWAPRPYWTEAAFVSGILCFVLFLFYCVLNFRKSSLSLFWLAAAVVTGCFMILVQLPFMDSRSQSFPPAIKSKEDVKRQEEAVNAPRKLALFKIQKDFILMKKNMAKAKIEKEKILMKKAAFNDGAEEMPKDMAKAKAKAEAQGKVEDTTIMERKLIYSKLKKMHNSLNRRQTMQDALYNTLLQNNSGKKLLAMRNEIKKTVVPENNYDRLSLADLEKSIQALSQWDKKLSEWQIVLKQTGTSIFEWVRTPYLPDYIESKLYAMWNFRTGTVRTGGNTVIDGDISLNSVGAFIRYFPRALQVGFLSPFPSEWFKTGSMPATTVGKRIMGGAMILFYICLAFFIWSLWTYRKRLEVWIITLSSTFGVMAFTYAYPNVGSFSRMRYGFYMVIIGIGFAFAVQKIVRGIGDTKSRIDD